MIPKYRAWIKEEKCFADYVETIRYYAKKSICAGVEFVKVTSLILKMLSSLNQQGLQMILARKFLKEMSSCGPIGMNLKIVVEQRLSLKKVCLSCWMYEQGKKFGIIYLTVLKTVMYTFKVTSTRTQSFWRIRNETRNN